jgi:hypothetical protein
MCPEKSGMRKRKTKSTPTTSLTPADQETRMKQQKKTSGITPSFAASRLPLSPNGLTGHEDIKL